MPHQALASMHMALAKLNHTYYILACGIGWRKSKVTSQTPWAAGPPANGDSINLSANGLPHSVIIKELRHCKFKKTLHLVMKSLVKAI